MELKDQVQGVVLGLFGAYAGGYLADLTSQAENGNPVELAAGLVSLQTPLLGVDLADDSVWVDTILGHLGVSSTSAAYTAAAAWANGELDAGASRANVIIAAVAYLLGDDVEAQYADVATAFKADVAAGVEWSEGDGKDVLGIADLRVEAGNPATGSSFNLTAALAGVDTALADQKAFFAALDLDFNGEADYTAAQVKAAGFVTTADAALTAALNTKAGATALGGAYVVGAAEAVNNASLALREATLDSNLAAAQKTLTDTNKVLAAFEATTAGTGATKAVTEWQAAFAVLEAADKTLVTAQADYAAAVAKVLTSKTGNNDSLEVISVAPVGRENDVVIYDADVTIADDPGTALVDEEAANDTVVATYDATAKVFKLATGITETAYPGITAYVAALNTLEAATKAQADATDVNNAKQTIVANWVGDPDGAANVYNTLLSLATAIQTQTTSITAAEKAIADFDKALAELNKVIELDAQRDDLADAVTAAEKVIADAGFAVNKVATDVTADVGTSKNDVFVFDKAAGSISLFGAAGDDVLFVGSSYVLNTGKVATDGVDNQLEVFIQAKAGAAGTTQVIVETSAFGSNATVPETFTIELVGVTVDQVTFANGYVQLA